MEEYHYRTSIYAHTSSGKTYTMQGGDTDDTKGHETVPRTAVDLSNCRYSANSNFSIISGLGLYMEQVINHLNPKNERNFR